MGGPHWRSGQVRGKSKKEWYYSFIAEVLGPEISAELIREAHSIPLEEIKQERYETSRFYRYLCRQVKRLMR